MKNEIHPNNYRVCAFKDMSTGDVTLIRSCAPTKEMLEVDGQEYPLVKMEVSSYSHPLHGQAEIAGYSRSRGQVPQPLRQVLQVIGLTSGHGLGFPRRTRICYA